MVFMKKITRVMGLLFTILPISFLTSCFLLDDEELDSDEEVVEVSGMIKIGKTSSDFKYLDRKKVKSTLEGKGFTNIRFNPVENTSLLASNGDVKSVSIGGSTKYSKSAEFASDVEIIINFYANSGSCTNGFTHTWRDVPAEGNVELIDCMHSWHEAGRECEICNATDYVINIGEHTIVVDPYIPPTLESDGKSEGSHCSLCNEVIVEQKNIPWRNSAEEKAAIEELESLIPLNNAQRAAVTGITNYLALDVSIDPVSGNLKNAHSYSDTTGNLDSYYLWVNDFGTWSYLNETTWHCEKMKLTSYGYQVQHVRSFDITLAGGKYIIINIDDARNVSESQKNDWDASNPAFTIDPSLIGSNSDRIYGIFPSKECNQAIAGSSDYELTVERAVKNYVVNALEYLFLNLGHVVSVSIPFSDGFNCSFNGGGIWNTSIKVSISENGTKLNKRAYVSVDLVTSMLQIQDLTDN